ncbi:xanthine dehydrogenase family protein molybdopterin-binding subunit [Cochlodiniinecator piscidefendens]|uniref:xanthine dehydrogenase family protein molybdopterin-binding subunit n=1 Tax=Cochlodiniinecator piscidefendens TaxID=2715756 RepID=UPI00140E4A13|nr:xanthine dehydrogenase family protein molybdopterin-binding subunit [Cochlodiniinecator piscidefendens]
MEKFGKSQPVKRVEDQRFLRGTGGYIDDVAPDTALYAYFFRSPVGHAHISLLDLSDARDMPGVHLVASADDLTASGVDIGLAGSQVKNLDGSLGAGPRRPSLAEGRVRFVGEAIAVIVAETLDQARDAAEVIEFEYEDLPAHVDLNTGGEVLHEEAPENRAFHWGMGQQDATQAAFDTAVHRVSLQVMDSRVIVNSMEPRGCYSEWDGTRLHLAFTGQGVWGLKADLIKAFGLSEDNVRVTNPDIGGGFGMKAMRYPEYVAVAAAAKILKHPVRWVSERTEAMLTDNHGRDLTSLCELAFDENHKITAYRVNTTCNLGAYNSQFGQPIQTDLFSKVLMGTYDVQLSWLEVTGVYTSTTPVDAYRGAGRPEAIFALERTMDHAARELGVDPWELRRKNFIKPEQFPYRTTTGEIYDVGDFERVLDHVIRDADIAGFADRKKRDIAAGKLRGLGLCYYIESILGDPSESAKVEFNGDGTASILVGTQSGGQGHETVYAQFLSDQSGIPPELIHVVQGDSDKIAQGGGTGGSRSVTVQNNAILATVDVMVTSMVPFVAEVLDVPPESVHFDHQVFRSDLSNQTPTLLDVADWARDMGLDDLLRHEARATLPARSYPNGAHVAEIVIDRETGQMNLDRYTVVDDFGNMINPMLVAGQVHGGIAQGVGQAMMERVVHDPDGQLLTATFMDYAMPRADDLPMIGFDVEPVPSTANALGMKGCGEAGTVGAMAALANAVHDALAELGIREAEMPYTPHRIWELMEEARAHS